MALQCMLIETVECNSLVERRILKLISQQKLSLIQMLLLTLGESASKLRSHYHCMKYIYFCYCHFHE
jgi:hypothetical protein